MKVLVIGNGIAGFSAASTMRQLNERWDVTMISKETTPLYSACVLPDYISGKISRKGTFVKTHKDYKRLGMHTLFGHEVLEIDPTSKKLFIDNRKHLSFDKLVLATGSEPVVFGEYKKGIFKIKTLKDADELIRHKGEKAIIIGSGPVAIEIATALHYQRYQVTIIARFNQVLRMFLDKKPADKVMAILEERGINVRCGERVESVLGKGKVESLVTTKGDLECDTLIWAAGMLPRVSLARRADIAIGEKGGIKVNSHLETSVSGIYACGDCIESQDILTGEPSLNLLWQNANRQGSMVARNVTGILTNYPGSHKIMNRDVFGNHVVSFGVTEASLYRSKDTKPLINKSKDLSIIEQERDNSYFRLVIVGDRCMGGQFININQGLGMLYSIMFQRKSIKELFKMFDVKDLICRRPWFRQTIPFFINQKLDNRR